MLTKSCSACNSEFTCNAERYTDCWCSTFPKIMPMNTSQDCLCAPCLTSTINEQINSSINTKSLTSILEIAGQFKSDAPLVEQIDYTMKNGNYVFSKWYHLKRGTCCGNNCTNCPYPPTSNYSNKF